MKIKDGYVLREVAGEYFIIPVGPESINNSRMITINETGKTMWESLQGGTDYDALVKTMLDMYDISEEVLKPDIDSFLDILRNAQLLEE